MDRLADRYKRVLLASRCVPRYRRGREGGGLWRNGKEEGGEEGWARPVTVLSGVYPGIVQLQYCPRLEK